MAKDVHKWLVLASAFVALMIQDGFVMSIGALFVAIVEEYDTTRAEAALVQSTLTGVYLCSGVLTGWLVKRFGPLKSGFAASSLGTIGASLSYFAKSVPYLVVSIGFVVGFGSSMLSISASTVTESYFEGNLKLVVLSILTTGSCAGGLAYPYLLSYLNKVYGLIWTFLLVGAICCNNICCSLLWSRPEQVGVFIEVSIESETSVDATKVTARETEKVTETGIGSFTILIKNKPYVCFIIAVAITMPTYFIFLIFIVDIFADKGYAESDALLGLVIWNSFNLVVRLTPGYIMKIPKFPDMGLLIISTFLCCLAVLCSSLISNLMLSFFSCAIVGLCCGVLMVMFSVGTLRLVGPEQMPTAMGLLFTVSGITTSGVAPLCGLARDRTDSYAIPIYSAAACQMVSCLLFITVHFMQRRRNKEYVFPPTK